MRILAAFFSQPLLADLFRIRHVRNIQRTVRLQLLSVLNIVVECEGME